MSMEDVDLIINYFLQSDQEFLREMGVDPKKLPPQHEWRRLILEDLERPLQNKKFYYLIWELNDSPVGHSNINKIVYGKEAYMHFHLWDPMKRQRGSGQHFIRECIFRYFEKFDLQNLFCEPYAENPGPNRTLARVDFEFVNKYDTTPGWINFHQTVNRWALTRERWLKISCCDTEPQ